MITRENIHSIFHYRDDGNLVWAIRPSQNTPKGALAGGKPGDKGYRRIEYQGRTYSLHRLIFLYHHGWMPKIVDHKDRNPLNNRIENLRDLSDSHNQINSDRCTCRVGYKGVTKHGNRYKSRITKNKIIIHLGFYATPEEAHIAYLKARDKEFPGVYHGTVRH